ncbi:hypothetical protein CDIK_3196 [Cucumispora dikerogammari]|nr:hypothetical protein CDIK_3196 [Cucumispora dikerogammari]
MLSCLQFNEKNFRLINCSTGDSVLGDQERLYVKASCLVKDVANLSDLKYPSWDTIPKFRGENDDLKELILKSEFPDSTYNSTKTPEKALLLIPLFSIRGEKKHGLQYIDYNSTFRKVYWSLGLAQRPLFSFSPFDNPGPVKSIKLNETEIYLNKKDSGSSGSAFLLFKSKGQFVNSLYIGAFIGETDDKSKDVLDSFYQKYLLNKKKAYDKEDIKIEISLDIRHLIYGMVVPTDLINGTSYITLYLKGFDFSSNNYILTVNLIEKWYEDEVCFEVKKRIGDQILDNNIELKVK